MAKLYAFTCLYCLKVTDTKRVSKGIYQNEIKICMILEITMSDLLNRITTVVWTWLEIFLRLVFAVRCSLFALKCVIFCDWSFSKK